MATIRGLLLSEQGWRRGCPGEEGIGMVVGGIERRQEGEAVVGSKINEKKSLKKAS